MELLAVSKDAVRAHVIRYFHDVFGTPTSAFKPGTNVRSAYSYSDRAWSQLANVFNKLSWMRQLGALLSPREMPALKTIEDLTGAIWGKLSKVISVSGLTTRFQASGVRTFAAPKRRASKSKRKSAPKPKRKATKKPGRKKPNG
jgi:hypothetical protein